MRTAPGDSEFTVKKADGGKEKYKLVRNIDETSKNMDIRIFKIEGKQKADIGTYKAGWDGGMLVIDMARADGTGEKYEFKKITENTADRYVCIKTEYDANNQVLRTDENLYSEKTVQSVLAGYDPYSLRIQFLVCGKGKFFQNHRQCSDL